MPHLNNLRHERFAQLRAKGYSLVEAYEMAGFIRDTAHAARLARRPLVAGRIAELRLEVGQAAPKANLEQTIAGLLAMVEQSEFQCSPGHLAEKRACLLEAHRLHAIWLEQREADRQAVARSRPKGSHRPARARPAEQPANGRKAAIHGPFGPGAGGVVL